MFDKIIAFFISVIFTVLNALGLPMKFTLTMENGKRVDVTRSYYYIFKEAFGI